MKAINTMIWLSIFFLFGQNAGFATAPRTIGGLVLGGNIDDFKEKLKLETDQPIRFKEYLREVQIKHIPGYKSGVVWYTAQGETRQIVRIKLKYEDSSRSFYDALLKQFAKRFGKPDQWRGDCFDVFIAWKWTFRNSEKDRISMILQHNIKDLDKKIGNNIKLTMWNLIEEERRMFEEKQQETQKTVEKQSGVPPSAKSLNWEVFLPR